MGIKVILNKREVSKEGKISGWEKKWREEELNRLAVILMESKHEPKVCRHFMCNKHLTLRESLFGHYCVKHVNTAKVFGA